MISQIITKSKSFKSQFQSKPAKRQNTIKSLIQSADFQSWVYLNQIISVFVKDKNDDQIAKMIKQIIQNSIHEIKSFAMLMYIYTLQVQQTIDLQFIDWSTLYKQLCVRDNQLIIFNSWAFNPQSYSKNYDLIQNTLQMIGKHYSQFLKSNKIAITDLQFDSIVQWILRMKIQVPQKFEIVTSLARKIKQISIVKHQMDYISKEHLVIKKIFQNIGDKINDSGNVYLLLQPEKYYTQKEVNYFCHIYYEYLLNLSQEYLCNAFINLSLGGVTIVTLKIIDKVSCLLSTNEQFFKLRFIYQNFVLPLLAKYKTHNNLSRQVYNIVEFYAVGFLKHCYIGRLGMQYLLQDIQQIQTKQLQQKWVKMILVLGQMNQLTDQVKNQLKSKGLQFSDQQISNKNVQKFIDMDKVWQITLRTGKKHKKYTKMLCNCKGIQNRANECYIISVVQGLFNTSQLQKIIDQKRLQIKQKFPLLDQMRVLFSQLDGRKKTQKIVISYLKRQGPQIYRQSHHQEDAMQYLIHLFDCLEIQCKKIPGLLEKFDQIFKIDCQHTTKCLNCQSETKNIQNSYIHTIPHTDILHLKTQEELDQYECQKCHKVGHCKSTRVISPKCKIFIVHINRFSIGKDGKCKKQLSNQTILRQFLNYQLVGILCHIGKSIDSGHYIYFSKLDQKTWVELNDRMAYKFQVDDPQEQFERQMNPDMSPYILFYKRRD